MTIEPATESIFLSDLHLAAGPSSQGESFYYDSVFVRFLAHSQNQAHAHGRQLHLILLGDVFDFLRTESLDRPQIRYSLDTSASTAIEKIRRIASGHSEFFCALSRLLDDGGYLKILPGNHDIELIHEPVQAVFKDLVARHCQRETYVDRLSFHPWVYFLPGVLYAEHGQQQHFINAIPNLLELSVRQPKKKFNLPLGSHFELFITSPSSTVREKLRFAVAILQDIPRHRLVGSRRVQPGVLQPVADATGLSLEALTVLDQHSRFSSWNMLQSILRLQHKTPGDQLAVGGYLYQAAIVIHQLLRSKNQSVPYYIFGHTHQPARIPIEEPDRPTYYLNAGSWIGVDHPGAITPASPGAFRFVRITVQPDTEAIGELLAWNDYQGRIETVLT